MGRWKKELIGNDASWLKLFILLFRWKTRRFKGCQKKDCKYSVFHCKGHYTLNALQNNSLKLQTFHIWTCSVTHMNALCFCWKFVLKICTVKKIQLVLSDDELVLMLLKKKRNKQILGSTLNSHKKAAAEGISFFNSGVEAVSQSLSRPVFVDGRVRTEEAER